DTAPEGQASPHALAAAQLVRAGLPGAIALPYALDTDGAERFFGPLYRRLADGAGLAEAVAEGRRALVAEPRRNSPLGPLPLADWTMPMLYQQDGDVQLARSADQPTRRGSADGAATGTRPAAETPAETALAPLI